MVTADDMDMTLNLDEQTGTPAPTEPTEQTEQTEPTEQLKQIIQHKKMPLKQALKRKFPTITDCYK